MDRSAQVFFRKAAVTDIDPVWRIILQAKEQMRLLGSRQWQDGYPAPGHISADIGRNRGYVLCKPGVESPLSVIAYGAVVFDGEPAYDAIDGQWLTDEPYVLVHRIAVADGERGRGVAAEFLHRVETLAQERSVKAFRIDTNFDNQTMLRLLERTGFTYCGKVVYRSGERLAYEKRL